MAPRHVMMVDRHVHTGRSTGSCAHSIDHGLRCPSVATCHRCPRALTHFVFNSNHCHLAQILSDANAFLGDLSVVIGLSTRTYIFQFIRQDGPGRLAGQTAP